LNKVLVQLQKSKNLKFVKLIVYTLDEERFEETGRNVANLILGCRGLERLVLRDNDHYVDLEKVPSFYASIEVPQLLHEYVVRCLE
jgi:hypothetical protein